MPDLTKLIERLEAAKEGSIDLDREIWQLCEPGDLPQPYTSSLDSAALVVPKGYDWILANRGEADVWLADMPGNAEATWASTPALALVIAALKARQSDAR